MIAENIKKIKDTPIPDDLISIIILNYNAGDLLLDCVSSIFK